MDNQDTKWLRWQILSLEILELATSLTIIGQTPIYRDEVVSV